MILPFYINFSKLRHKNVLVISQGRMLVTFHSRERAYKASMVEGKTGKHAGHSLRQEEGLQSFSGRGKGRETCWSFPEAGWRLTKLPWSRKRQGNMVVISFTLLLLYSYCGTTTVLWYFFDHCHSDFLKCFNRIHI